MPKREITLSPPRQVHLLGRGIGALRVKPDATDLEAIVGVFDPDAGTPDVRLVRPGDDFTVAGMRFQITNIVPPPDSAVSVTVTWPDELER